MSWSDGVTKELAEYLETVGGLGNKSKAAIMEQVDIDAKAVYDALQRNAPRDTGGLVASLLKSRCTVKRNWYGWSLEFQGNHPDGTPYQKIANILNYGNSERPGTRFITNAIRQLKGMDDRIADRYEKQSNPH
jgi:hypothetical protein